MVPKSWRAAATTALSGFHSAITRSQVGMFWVGTNTLEMNPSRNAGSIDSEGADLAQAWRKVKVPGHVEAVLEAAKSL